MPAPAAAAGAGTSAFADADGGDAAANAGGDRIRLNNTIKNVLVALLQNSSSEVVAGLPSMRATHGKTNLGHVVEAKKMIFSPPTRTYTKEPNHPQPPRRERRRESGRPSQWPRRR
tara:strand:+ start:208 stop:555 length:348 start_codon:yes stop_codon:yes gene_type:complete